METYVNPPREQWAEICQRPVMDVSELEKKVSVILNDIRIRGDRALVEYTEKFDGVSLNDLRVTDIEIEQSINQVDEPLKQAMEVARDNIEKFHMAQQPGVHTVETMPGVKCWQKAVPIQKVGLYIPGGSAPLFSTVLMLAIPAVIAGCEEIVLCTPPAKDGKVHPAILFAAQLVGVTKVFKAGGAQAIAAMAYGTESIPAVNKIFGPGNQYVTAAKQLITRDGVAIDMPAGPSEVLVIADSSANPEFVASDLLSQAEHGPDSQVILVVENKVVLSPVEKALQKQLQDIPRKEIAIKAMKNSKVVIFNNHKDIVDFTNAYAPEHLIISTLNFEEISSDIVNAGSVFLGNFTPESAGDYASGTNHTLPTNGYARAYNGVNLDSYFKKITFQYISREGLANVGETIMTMAKAEQLEAHSKAVEIRLKEKNNNND